MSIIFYLTFLLLIAFGKSNEANMLREEASENGEKAEKEDEVAAFESFGSPVYGPSNIISPSLPLNGKSAYSYPIPPVSPLQALPANYLSYLTALGYGNPYPYGAYNRYGILPYTASSLYGYGSPLSSNILPGYAGYGSPFLGRSVYPGTYAGFPGFLPGLGYRYGAFGYPAAASLKAGSAALARASTVGVPVPIPRVSTVAASLPAPVASVPAPIAGVPAPVAGVPGPVAPYPAGLPLAFNGIPGRYGPVIRPIQGKDGTVRYTATDV